MQAVPVNEENTPEVRPAESQGMTDRGVQRRADTLVIALSVGAMLIAVAVFAWLSYTQSYMADDFATLLRTRDTGLVEYVVSIYQNWTGRMLPTVVSWMVIPHRLAFALLNAAVLLGIVLVTFRLGAGHWPRRDARDLLATMIVFAALWFGSPQADETLMWRVGAFNYSWVLLPSLVVLVPFRSWYSEWYEGRRIQSSVPWAIVLFVAGVIAGLSQEQTAAAAATVVSFFFVAVILRRLLRDIPVQLYTAAAGLYGGLAVLVTAPGSYQRLALEPQWAAEQRFDVFKNYLVQSFDVGWRGAFPWLLLIIVLGLTVAPRLSARAAARRAIHPLLPVAAFAVAGLVVLLPLYRTAWSTGTRATFATFGFVLVAAVFFMCGRPGRSVIEAIDIRGLMLLALIVAGCLVVDAAAEYRATVAVESVVKWRETLIRDVADSGGGEVTLPPLTLSPRRLQFVSDFSGDPTHWSNTAAAEYYGVDSIKVEESKQ